jgi:hypothetical protein
MGTLPDSPPAPRWLLPRGASGSGGSPEPSATAAKLASSGRVPRDGGMESDKDEERDGGERPEDEPPAHGPPSPLAVRNLAMIGCLPGRR